MFNHNSLFYPTTYQTLMQSIHDPSQQQQLSIEPQYFLPASEMVAWMLKTNGVIDSVKSFVETQMTLNQMQNKKYFDVEAQELQETVNRLNIQQRLSKQQLNDQQCNGYRKIKVIMIQIFVHYLFHFTHPQIYIYINKYLF